VRISGEVQLHAHWRSALHSRLPKVGKRILAKYPHEEERPCRHYVVRYYQHQQFLVMGWVFAGQQMRGSRQQHPAARLAVSLHEDIACYLDVFNSDQLTMNKSYC
jgi:hypothetical protein